MKAEFDDEGYIVITPETVAEVYAIRHLMPSDSAESCGECGRQDLPVLIDTRIPDPAK